MSELPKIEGAQGQKRRRRGCFLGMLGCLGAGVVLIAAACVAVIMSLDSHPVFTFRHSSRGEDDFPRLKTVWSCGSGDTKAIRIPISGVIMNDYQSGIFGRTLDTVDVARRRIKRATNDPDIKAIILEIDSPGGGITASDVIYNALLEFKKKEPGRVVIAVLYDVAASGGYYVAAAADYIIAHPTTLTGSIGVLISTLNVKELADKVGVKDITIKSGENKDILNPFADFTPEQEIILKEIIDEMHGRFVKLIAESRKIEEAEVREIADGRIFTAATALDHDLIDQIGYWEDAVTKTSELLGVNNVRIYRYEPEFSLSELLRSSGGVNFNLETLLQQTHPRLMYLWRR